MTEEDLEDKPIRRLNSILRRAGRYTSKHLQEKIRTRNTKIHGTNLHNNNRNNTTHTTHNMVHHTKKKRRRMVKDKHHKLMTTNPLSKH